MKILAINGGTSGSSWNICRSILDAASIKGHDVYAATPNEKPADFLHSYYKIGNKIDRLFNKFITKIDGSDGFRNKLATNRLLSYISKIKPDVVHLHTLHGHFINIGLLIQFLKSNRIKLIITCHDCWWFTGRCAHFFSNSCNCWKNDGCKKCRFKNAYPKTFFVDKASKFLFQKKQLFENYDNLTIVCVSDWLRDLCLDSLVFRNCNVLTIHNGVDTSIYDLPSENLICTNFNLISVASQWNNSKGIEIILALAKIYPNLNFTVVGKLSNRVSLPKNVSNISTIQSKYVLNKLYQQSYALLNPSTQETFSLVNVEAQLCGLPVICMNETGMTETVSKESYRVNEYSLESFKKAIDLTISTKFERNKIRLFAETFSLEKMIYNYLEVYTK